MNIAIIVTVTKAKLKNIWQEIVNKKKYLLFFTLLPLAADIITKNIIKQHLAHFGALHGCTNTFICPSSDT